MLRMVSLIIRQRCKYAHSDSQEHPSGLDPSELGVKDTLGLENCVLYHSHCLLRLATQTGVSMFTMSLFSTSTLFNCLGPQCRGHR